MLKMAPCSVVWPNGKCWWFNKINNSNIKELKTIIKSGIKVILLYFNAIICTMVHFMYLSYEYHFEAIKTLV